jgi:hypothetical protein
MSSCTRLYARCCYVRGHGGILLVVVSVYTNTSLLLVCITLSVSESELCFLVFGV